MINLLPPNKRSLLLASRSNSLLIRYCFATLALAILLALLTGLVYIVLTNSRSSVEDRLAQAEARTAKYSDIQKQADEYRHNLAVAKTVLNSGTDYSKIIVSIARDLPQGVALSSLTLNEDSFNKPMTLEVTGNDEYEALQVKASLEKSDLFDNVYIESITKNDNESTKTQNLLIRINVTLNPEGIKQNA